MLDASKLELENVFIKILDTVGASGCWRVIRGLGNVGIKRVMEKGRDGGVQALRITTYRDVEFYVAHMAWATCQSWPDISPKLGFPTSRMTAQTPAQATEASARHFDFLMAS